MGVVGVFGRFNTFTNNVTIHALDRRVSLVTNTLILNYPHFLFAHLFVVTNSVTMKTFDFKSLTLSPYLTELTTSPASVTLSLFCHTAGFVSPVLVA